MKGTAINSRFSLHLLFQVGFCLGLLGVARAGDDPSLVASIEIVEKGIYKSDLLARLPSPGEVGGTVLSANPKLIQATTTILFRVGLLFGIRYKPIGDALGEVAPLHLTIIFPPPGLRTLATNQLQPAAPRDVRRTIGDIHFFGATFDSESDLVPGTWVFQISQNGRMLAEEKFEVIGESK